jgi:hypothetical protein
MLCRGSSLTFALSLAAMVPALAADNTPFKVKPGLWETNAEIERSGVPPIPPEVLARLTPEQRAKLDQQPTGPHHSVSKRCLTQTDVDKGFEPMTGDGGRQVYADRDRGHVNITRGPSRLQRRNERRRQLPLRGAHA